MRDRKIKYGVLITHETGGHTLRMMPKAAAERMATDTRRFVKCLRNGSVVEKNNQPTGAYWK